MFARKPASNPYVDQIAAVKQALNPPLLPAGLRVSETLHGRLKTERRNTTTALRDRALQDISEGRTTPSYELLALEARVADLDRRIAHSSQELAAKRADYDPQFRDSLTIGVRGFEATLRKILDDLDQVIGAAVDLRSFAAAHQLNVHRAIDVSNEIHACIHRMREILNRNS